MSINWQDLRSLDGSQYSAFEELTCQLASAEEAPVGAKFIRKGAPDAGVECYWQLPDNTEWGWQAKFFLSPPDTAQWRQIDESVKTALDKHPKLSRYVVCFPIDRQDPRIPDQQWFMDKWGEHVNKWKNWAITANMAVEFEYWGAHEFFAKLSREEHKGRYYFWFHRDLFSQEWYRNRVEEAIANVGPRYSPELDVHLPIARLFQGMGRTVEFQARIKNHLKEIRKTYPRRRNIPTSARSQQLEESYAHLGALIGSRDWADVSRIDWDGVLNASSTASEAAWELSESCAAAASAIEKEPGTKDRREEIEQLKYLASDYRRLYREFRDLHEFVETEEVQLSNLPALLLVAEAGRGKTHLFCDVALHRLENKAPTVLLIGGQFNLDEPWSQIIRLLGLNCSKEEFIGALEASAQAANTRALIFVDALNEGQGKGLWKKHLAGILLAVSRSPWLGIALSLRTSYEETIVPEGVIPTRLIRAVHHGFADHEYQATKTFFEYFGIQRPSIPLLVPEFQNPLFLKIFCQSLKNNGLSVIPPGLQGITAIFRFFLDSVNKKLAAPEYLNYNTRLNTAWKAVSALASELAHRHGEWLSIEDAQAILHEILPREGYEQSLYRHLLSEGVIAENRFYIGNREWADGVHFAYERFTDHLIAKHLLDTYLDENNPGDSFAPDGQLWNYVQDQQSCAIHQGLIEAWSIQLPERIGKELFELVPSLAGYHTTVSAFIESIIWRDPHHLDVDIARSYINTRVLRSHHHHTSFLNALLTVAVNPDHPLNAEFLHHNLLRRELANRDSSWSIFLHEQYGVHNAVDRLVDWAWSEEDKSHIADEPIRLCGMALSWFLTTSHRFLRDRTTKALVRLFTNRIAVLRAVIQQFIEVNDPYVLERLMAAAYGCTLRSQHDEAVQHLAQDIYTWLFRDGHPPVHILLRDYARGVIEVALHRGIVLDIEVGKVRPPYGSSFPDVIPSEEELKARYNSFEEGKRDVDYAQSEIWFSVIGGGDFDRYVIGTNSGRFEWSNRRLGELEQPTRKEQFEAFKVTLTAKQQTALERYQLLLDNIAFYRRLEPSRRKEYFSAEFTDEQLDAAMADAENRLRKQLGKRKSTNLTGDIIRYLRNPHEDELAFDISLAQRWILQRVFELGWTVERFGQFDRYVNYNDGRETRKPERIGKKYQWIAYYEFLARVADNFALRGDSWREPELKSYDGPWQDMYIRDIDPSWVLPNTRETTSWHGFSPTWWAPVSKDWDVDLSNRDWIRKDDDLPAIEPLITVSNPSDNSQWLTLEGSYRWEHPEGNSDDETHYPQRTAHYFLQGYLLQKMHADALYEWMKTQWRATQNFQLPDSHPLYRVFLGEFFWAPAFLYHYVPYHHHDDWIGGEPDDAIPHPLLVTTDQYTQEGNGFDCSIEETVHVYVPCKRIADGMDLRWNGVEGQFIDAQERLIAIDPSVHAKGPGALLIRREPFLAYLEENGLEILWVVTGEKVIITGDAPGGKDWVGRLNILGVYRLNGVTVQGELLTNVSD